MTTIRNIFAPSQVQPTENGAASPAAPVLAPYKRPPLPDGFIDVKQLIASHDIAEHAKLADDYFKDFTLDNVEFRKPFMGHYAPQIVTSLGIVLSNLDYYPGMRVLDFGCGTAWLSQSLALMHCRAVAVDVSRNALKLGEQATKNRYPEIAGQITYLPYDGVRIDLPDASMDRVVCFDCFHHVANQKQLLSEFQRILTPDGRAVFCEPGPFHSWSDESQQVMRDFGVIENDIFIEDIWAQAKEVGFRDIRLTVMSSQPQHISLQELDSLRSFETARPVLRRAYDEIYGPLYHGHRMFILLKDPEIPDSRRAAGLAASIDVKVETLPDVYRITGTARNTGTSVWRASGADHGCVNVGIYTKPDENGPMTDFARITFLKDRLPPGDEAPFAIDIEKSRIKGGPFYLDLVSEYVLWFSGDKAVRLL